jgi:hypothetical protein
MLRVDGKKINTAFRRLRERRQAVGIESTSETPEQELDRVKKEMAAAQATGDISTIIRIITRTSKLTTEDFIKKTCGGLLFLYYTYVEKLHVRPHDMIDMIDGILFLDAKSYIIKTATEDK